MCTALTAAGLAPLTYLTKWRMRLAERALREKNTPVSVLARSLGYTSESAFSNAFKRATGHAPKRYRSIVRASGSAGEVGHSNRAPRRAAP
jgi:AraC-like DNA-binding protein